MSFPRSGLGERYKGAPPLPQDLANQSWTNVREPIAAFLEWCAEQGSGTPGGFKEVTPSTIEPDDVADPGTSSESWAAADHVHAIVTATASSLGNANAEGSATSFARSDHAHKRDVRVRLNGSDVGTRNALNFIASAGSVVDDSVGDEIEITMASEDAEILAMYGL